MSAVAIAVLAALTFGGATTRLERGVYDRLMRLSPRAASDDIVIVTIDDASLAALGRWPWPRQRHAEFFARMAEARPRIIAYDVLFAEPDGADAALGQAIHVAGPTFLPLRTEIPGPDGRGAVMYEPVAPLAAAATGLGQVDIGFDPDGVVRRVFLFESDGRRTAPQLMLAMKAHLDHAPISPPAMRPSPGLRRTGEALIRFQGPAGTYRTVPFVSVLKGEVSPEVFRDKIVLVGATANGLNDRYATPMRDAGGMSGVEIQANLLQALRAGTTLRLLGPWGSFGFGLLAVAVLLAACRRLSPRANLLTTVGLGAAMIALSAWAFFILNLWAPPVAGLMTLALVYPLWSWRRLEATSRYMLQELERFRGDQEVWADPPQPGGGDVVQRQLDLMDGAVGRMRQLRVAIRTAAEQRERLLALLTHDMRSPQASILALLKTAAPGEVGPALAKQISTLAGRTLTLADNFVLLARAEAETYDLQLVSLSSILVEAVDELWPQSSLRGVAIETDGIEDEHLVVGDRSLLTRALINLIDNAIKYSDRGAVVRCVLTSADGMAACSIADRGRGMTPEELARIYQPFQRAGEQSPGGAGLGLALVRAVVQRHGGRIDHASTEGAGTIATWALPIAQP